MIRKIEHMFGGQQMIISVRCSDEAFLELVRAAADHYGIGGWEIMFGEGAEDKDVLEDKVGAMQSVVALMEAMAC